jgi:hypothetical protein
MSEETENVQEPTDAVDNTEQVIVDLQGQLKQINQKLVDANEEAMRRRKTNERLSAELEQIKSAPSKTADSNEEIIAQIKAEHQKQLSDAQGRLNSLLQKNAMTELQAALSASDIVAAGLQPLALMARDRIVFDESGNIRIMNADGSKPLAGSGSDGYATIGDLAKELAASETGLHFTRDAGVSGGGKPPASTGNKSGMNTVTRTQFNNMNDRERGAFFKNGGKVVD